MKCYYHPKEDAVAVCKSCGKGVCKDCAIVLSGDSHCKTCVEEGRVRVASVAFPQQQLAEPKPSGIPSKTPFIIGSIGAIMAGVAAILSIFTGYASLLFGWSSYGSLYGNAGVAVSIFLAVGIILAGIGYKGIKSNYGPSTGTAGFALSIVTSVLFFVTAALGLVASYSYYSYYYYYYSSPWYVAFAISLIISLIMFGVTQIIYGVAHINCRRFTGNSGLGMATGILLIISGAFTASVLLTFVGMIMFLVGGILTLIVFIMAKIPQLQSN
jgi:hypothetical protein